MLCVRTFSACLVFTFSLVVLTQAAEQVAETAPPAVPSVNIEERMDIGLAALNLYNTFGCIGLAAEGWKAELYDAAKVELVMKDVSKTSNLAVQMLQRSIEKDPRIVKTTPVQDMIRCYGLLDRQAQLLTEAAKSSDERVEKVFLQTRDQSWEGIKSVLGIEE